MEVASRKFRKLRKSPICCGRNIRKAISLAVELIFWITFHCPRWSIVPLHSCLSTRTHLVKCVRVVFNALQSDRSEAQHKDDQRRVRALVSHPRLSQVGRILTERALSPLEPRKGGGGKEGEGGAEPFRKLVQRLALVTWQM